MSIVVNGFDGNPFDQRSIEGIQDRFITVHYRLAFSGSYVTGGDTLDFTNGGVNSAVPNLGRGIESVLVREMAASASSDFVGTGGYFEPLGVPGAVGAAGVTALNAWKIKLFTSGGSEASASTYSSLNVTVDVIELEVKWFLG